MVNFRHITEMENHGVNRTDVNKLMEGGYCTVESVSRRALVSCRVVSCRVVVSSSLSPAGSLLLPCPCPALLCCILQITHATLRKLTDIKGISEQKAQKIKEMAYKLVPMGFLTVRCRSLPVCLPVCIIHVPGSASPTPHRPTTTLPTDMTTGGAAARDAQGPHHALHGLRGPRQALGRCARPRHPPLSHPLSPCHVPTTPIMATPPPKQAGSRPAR